MAAIERGTGAEDRVVRAWLAKAVTAERGPQWVCGNCGHVHSDWRPICVQCESFDSLSWEVVEQSDAALISAAQMLPLIVGSLEDKRDEATAGTDEGVTEAELVDDAPDSPDAATEEITADAVADAEPVEQAQSRA
jgi:HemY protein